MHTDFAVRAVLAVAPGLHTYRQRINSIFSVQVSVPGTRQARLMKVVCQDWDLISSGLLQWSQATDNLFQPPKCDRYYILMLPDLNCISPRSPARMRSCVG